MKLFCKKYFLFFAAIFFADIFLFASPKYHPLNFIPQKKYSPYTTLRTIRYDDDSNIPGGWVCTASSIFSYVNYLKQPGTLSIAFPYKLSDQGSNAMTYQFSSAKENLTGTGKWVYPSVGLEVGKENFTIEGQMGLYFNNWSDNLYGGINWRFILKKAHRSPDQFYLGTVCLPGKKFMNGASVFPIKISAGFFYWQPIWNLGSIAIGSKRFDALGYTMNDATTLMYGGEGNIIVYFHQNILAFKPSFSIGWKPEATRFEFQFAVSPLIMISEVGGLRYYMRASAPNGQVVDWVPRDGISLNAVIPLTSYGMNATYNGEQLASTPYRLKGVMYSFKIGFRIGN